jgi:long-chain acyl-CoA synthetase
LGLAKSPVVDNYRLPKLKTIFSGAAPLGEDLTRACMDRLGCVVRQGYGMTETSPVTHSSPAPPRELKFGSVGVPAPNTECKIIDLESGEMLSPGQRGEVCVRGPQVMKGYLNSPEATAQTIDPHGWLHTGDIGTYEDGYLSVTDRKKHILVTSTGKNVAPQPLENALCRSRFIEQVTVVGDGRRFVAALIVPEFGALCSWAEKKGKATDRKSLCADAEVAELIHSEIAPLQADLARFERVRDFRLLPAPFTIEDGTLTPTLKAVRKKVEEKYAELIEDIYRQHGG